MAEISVIVPVYKVEAYLHRCIDSILAQTFSDFELILVDDGSPDNCGAICDEYAAKDNRIHVIHQENGGISAAHNAGIDWVFANSDSQWITFVDSDDWIHKDCLKILYETVALHGTQLCVCRIYRTCGEAFLCDSEKEVLLLSPDDFFEMGRSEIMPVPVSGKLYHKSLLDDLRFPVGKLHEDEFLTYRIVFAAKKISVSTAYLYAYYQNQNSIMNSSWNPRRLDGLEAIEQQIEYAQHSENDRFGKMAFDKYIWVLLQYIDELKEQLREDTTNKKYLRILRKRLRFALRTSKYRENYRLCKSTLYMYVEAYQLEPIWRATRFVYRTLKKDV